MIDEKMVEMDMSVCSFTLILTKALACPTYIITHAKDAV
jgi:hypothetical protein